MHRIGVALVLAGSLTAAAQEVLDPNAVKPRETSITTHIFRPAMVAATPDRIQGLKAPKGFVVSVFATGLKDPRGLLEASNGYLYVSQPGQGDILVYDVARPQSAPREVVTGTKNVAGLAELHGRLYYAAGTTVYAAQLKPDGTLEPPRVVFADLPQTGQHPRRSAKFGPDGKLYVTVGSDCNSCEDTEPEHATIVRGDPETGAREIFAKGLRDTIGFDWSPETHEMWGFDHGIDFLGDDLPEEELNHLQYGKNYGWPYAYNNRKVSPSLDLRSGKNIAEEAAKSEPNVLGYTAHAAPIDMMFYRGTQFPSSYRGDALVAMHGSWNRQHPSGYRVIRVRFHDGQPTGFEDFLTGFLVDHDTAFYGRPAGLALLRDGSILVSDDAGGVIYRVSYGPPTTLALEGEGKSP